jgi:Tol biopolymer transport system component
VISAAPLDSVVTTLYFVSRDGRQVRKVFDEATPAADRDAPSWSPDGLRIAFVRYGAQGAKVYVSNVDGSVERALVNDTRLQYDPSWSPTRP